MVTSSAVILLTDSALSESSPLKKSQMMINATYSGELIIEFIELMYFSRHKLNKVNFN